MKNYTEGITEEIIISNEIDGLQIMQEHKFEPRMIIKYKNGEEIIIDGDKDITKFFEKLKEK